MYIPTEKELKEAYQSYLDEIEFYDGDWGLSKALSYEVWKADQELYDYYSLQGL